MKAEIIKKSARINELTELLDIALVNNKDERLIIYEIARTVAKGEKKIFNVAAQSLNDRLMADAKQQDEIYLNYTHPVIIATLMHGTPLTDEEKNEFKKKSDNDMKLINSMCPKIDGYPK